MERLTFTTRPVGDITILDFRSGGCRPASDVEIECLAEITRLRSESEALRNLLAEIVKAHGTGNLEMNSPEIGGHDDIPLHPWHEEWLHHARAALKETDNG